MLVHLQCESCCFVLQLFLPLLLHCLPFAIHFTQLPLLHCFLYAIAVHADLPCCFGTAGLVLAAYYAAALLAIIDLISYAVSRRHTQPFISRLQCK